MSLKVEGDKIDSFLKGERGQWQGRIREVEAKLEEVEVTIKTAAAFGDLSENNEYTTAVDEKQRYLKEKDELTYKISQFDSQFEKYATKDVSRGELVVIGSVVRISYPEVQKQFVVKVVPPKADIPRRGAISSTSPLGRALLNKKAGERTAVLTERRKWTCVVEEVY